MLDAAGSLQEERRGSLGFRFANEDLLLAHARERIFFGWGSGRNFTRNASGEVVTTTDGHWIIVLGVAGAAGFLVCFGVLLWPVILSRRLLRNHEGEVDNGMLAGLAVIIVLVTVDLIPNGLFSSYPYLLAGALTRRLRSTSKSLPV
jgi:hypothetical protein